MQRASTRHPYSSPNNIPLSIALIRATPASDVAVAIGVEQQTPQPYVHQVIEATITVTPLIESLSPRDICNITGFHMSMRKLRVKHVGLSEAAVHR